MKKRKFIIYTLFFLILPILVFSNDQKYKRKISWDGIRQIQIGDNQTIDILYFTGSTNDPENDFLPQYYEKLPVPDNSTDLKCRILNAIYEPVQANEAALLNGTEQIKNSIEIKGSIDYERKKPYALVSFIPLRFNELVGGYEKLVSFELEISTTINPKSVYKSSSYVENSVLASGKWYKIAVTATGVYKITATDLENLGIDVNAINPKNIRIYGNGGGMLPENVSTFRYDDLQENAIFVAGESDGKFDASDYILFYGESPDEWQYSSSDKRFHKAINIYSDYTYYFITTDLGAGKRIQDEPFSSQTPNFTSNSFTDYFHHELELSNLIGSGRTWYGETFDINNTLIEEVNFPYRKLNTKIFLAADVAATSPIASSFSFYVNNQNVMNLPVVATSSTGISADFAKTRHDTTSFTASGNDFTLKLVYNKPLSSSVGYLNYFTLNVIRDLSFTGGQMAFRDTRTANQELVTEYTLSKVTSDVTLWNVSDPVNVKKVETVSNANERKFRVESHSLQEFIAFDGTSFYSVQLVGQVQNQNLHALGDYDMIIVTHPLFYEQAVRLANFHQEHDGLSVVVVTTDDIYTEFASGSHDITGIRDFVKMMYDKATPGKEPKYLLLFGDASYDYKDRIANNTNFVPTWESAESLNPVSSVLKDDYFGFLDEGNLLDIGIGRFIVSSVEQAKNAVDKSIHYATNPDETKGDWRNVICLIADDEDGNLHFSQTEELSAQIDTLDHAINLDKIYLDAYQQQSTPSGQRYPKVTEDINNRIARGALIINYVGHGGEGGLAHERIMNISDINSWTNYNTLPVFMTATCEFSRFDDPERVAAGEYVFLNPNGGAVALFSTSRATYSNGNSDLNQNFFKYVLNRFDGEYLRMGDVIRLAKNASGSPDNKIKFVLLGDPALKFALPENNVATAKIMNMSVQQITDTIQALSEINISGEIQDNNGQLMTDFNGTLFPSVFDKPSRYTTLGNDPASSPAVFYIQKNILYKGKANITGGKWNFSFIVPKDIAYAYGLGKITYYAKDNSTDASGYYLDMVVGGYNENAAFDNTGPEVQLYMNDENFKRGGITDENPVLYALIKDDNGINTVGSGIGHDITTTLDEIDSRSLNDFYESNLDDYKVGSIHYPFFNLSNGKHTLSLKVWDIYNNPTTVYTDFIVAESNEMAINSIMNYPNPFVDGTKFTFEHNQSDKALEITILIFSTNGQLVKTIKDTYNGGGYIYKSTDWQGTDDGGNRLKQGLYVYKVIVKSSDGAVTQGTSKLVIIK